MKNILCIAQSCCDMIFGAMPRLPGAGEEVYCREFAIKAGGGANTPIMLARMGVPVSFLTNQGADYLGEILKDAMEKSGLVLPDNGLKPQRDTPVSTVLSTGGDRSFASYGGSAQKFFTEEALEAEIKKADLVHTYGGYCLKYPIRELCKKYGAALSLDMSYEDAVRMNGKMLSGCSILKINNEEARLLTGKEDALDGARELAAQGIENVVVTMGEKGSLAVGHDKIYRQPPVFWGKFLDSCGAGDSFAAGLLVGAAQDMALQDMLKLGAILSGMCVTWYGGMSDSFRPEAVWKRFLDFTEN